MRVVHVINGLGGGGAEMVVFDLSRDNSRIKNEVYNIGQKIEFLDKFEEAKIKVISGFVGSTIIQKIYALVLFLNYIRKIEKVVLHAHMYHGLVFSVIAKLFFWRIRIIFTSHSYVIKGSAIRTIFIRLSKHFRYTDILFSSKQYSPIYKKKHVIIPNGIDFKCGDLPFVRRNWFEEDLIRVLMVGRLETVKNHRLAFEMLAELNMFKIELHLVGDGHLRNELLRYAYDLKITDKVIFHRFQRDVTPFYKSCDILLITSLWEGLPISLLEAGSFAMPIVSSKVGSIDEVISDETLGCVVEHKDLLEGLKNIILHSGESIAKGKNLQRKIFESYGIKEVRLRHQLLYKVD